MRINEKREPVHRMDFSRIVNVARTSVDDYGSGGWGFEFLRACRRNPRIGWGFAVLLVFARGGSQLISVRASIGGLRCR